MASNAIVTFLFIVLEEHNANHTVGLIGKAVREARNLDVNFERFIAWVENVPAYSHLRAQDPLYVDGTKGRVTLPWDTATVIAWAKEKWLDQEKNKKIVGHESYRPDKKRESLSDQGLIIVIGSRAYCGILAGIHLFDIPELASYHAELATNLLIQKPYRHDSEELSDKEGYLISTAPPHKWIIEPALYFGERGLGIILDHSAMLAQIAGVEI